MRHAPLPAHRVYLQRTIQEPSLTRDGRSLLFAMSADGRTTIHRMSLETGLQQSLTSEPTPSGGVTYGGGLYAANDEHLVFPSRDGRLWRLDLASGDQAPLMPAVQGVGAPALSPCGKYWTCAAEADSSGALLVGRMDGNGWPVRLPGSLSFVGDPFFGPGGAYIAWQTWPERVMPWDHAELRIARFARPLSECRDLHEALPAEVLSVTRDGVHLSFPLPHPDGRHLLFTSDETGWRSPWSYDLETQQSRRLALTEGEVGGPNWVLRASPLALGQGGTRLYAVSKSSGSSRLLAIDVESGRIRTIDSRFSCLSTLACCDGGCSGKDLLAYLAADPVTPAALVTREVDAEARGSVEVDRVSTSVGLSNSTRLSRPVTLTWRAPDGTEVWGIWTPAAGEGTAPVIVFIHGGPTAATELTYDATAQFYASRGYHYLAVNYRGSTQRGRAYQDLLRGTWGQFDVEDARDGAQALIERGAGDRRRVAIMGGSAGGYTTLMALGTQPEFWAAGISLYGVGDLYEVMMGSHRFEKFYEHTLVGGLPDAGRLWVERSPLTYVDRVRAPLLLFHGEQDKAVPVQQSIDFADAIRARKGIVELVTYEEEGHGFKREKNRKEVLDRSLAFLDKYVRCGQGPARP
ncbi:MAG: S9 family peptidase [Deltaproteobacteria bacterium]|nr:S9 family peptidase [Deltaproteobacteria bacterium]